MLYARLLRLTLYLFESETWYLVDCIILYLRLLDCIILFVQFIEHENYEMYFENVFELLLLIYYLTIY